MTQLITAYRNIDQDTREIILEELQNVASFIAITLFVSAVALWAPAIARTIN